MRWLRRGRAISMMAGLSIAPSQTSEPPMLFEDATQATGIDFVNVSGEPQKLNITGSLGSGAALFDYDQDGDLDLYVVNGARTSGVEVQERFPNRLFRNLGEWRFEDATEESGVGDFGWGMGCAVGDYDNDGLPDVYVTNLGANALYRNEGDGTFRDVTGSAGVGDPTFSIATKATGASLSPPMPWASTTPPGLSGSEW